MNVKYKLLTIMLVFSKAIFAFEDAESIALSAYEAQTRMLNISANNAANSNSIGYQADNVGLKTIRKNNNSYAVETGNYRSSKQGAIKQTNRQLDFAIIGENKYFMVNTPEGQRLTLNGNFFINNNGVLVNIDNYPLLGQAGEEIALPENASQIRSKSDGTIIVDNEEIAIIGVFEGKDMIKDGNSLYLAQSGTELADIAQYTLLQGVLRESNVNSTEEMMKLMNLQKSTAALSNMISEFDQTERSALQKILKQ